MVQLEQEPSIRVGLITGAGSLQVTLHEPFLDGNGNLLPKGHYTASADQGRITFAGPVRSSSSKVVIRPVSVESARFTIHGVTIGKEFHWQRQEEQTFQGALEILNQPGGICVINELPLEAYLVSVISSEMSAAAPQELLRAHAIVSRSWLLAQLAKAVDKECNALPQNSGELIKWYGRESHAAFDVCADDHCQRYQGITKAFSGAGAAFEAVKATRGKALAFQGEICDTRYSKCCGGFTEAYSTAWEDKDVPYLRSVYDGEGELADYPLPLTSHCNAGRFIDSAPPAYCNTSSPELLARILPGFDQETRDFYRWEVSYTVDELTDIVRSKLGIDLGRVSKLEPVERGPSGRIIKLRITGDKRTVTVGKELEIRRVLSRSHLYSSAFIVRVVKNETTGRPERFRLTGAGWGHGVGLCQIGAAVMADLEHTHERILSHYFRDAGIIAIY